MNRWFQGKVVAAGVFAAVSGFALGHRSLLTEVRPAVVLTGPGSSKAAHTEAPVNHDAPDFSKVRIDHLGELPFVQGYEFLRSAPPEALQQWARSLESMPVGPHQRASIKDFFRILSQVNTGTAVDLAVDLATRDARAIATKAIQAAAPPEGYPAVATLLGSQRSEKGDPLDFTDSWSAVDPVSASQFVERDFPDSERRSEAAMLVAENWAVRDPVAAKAWLEHLDPKDASENAYAGLVSGWMTSDEEAAVRYVVANAADKKMSDSIPMVARYLFTGSKERARDFVNALPSDKARDDAVKEIEANAAHEMIFSGADDDLPADEAARWMITLSPELQERHLGPVIACWYSEHPDAARAWLSTLPAETHDLAAAKGCLAWGWTSNRDDLHVNVEMAFSIRNRQLREKTLREFISDVKSSEDAEQKLATLKLTRAEKTELRRIVGNL